MFFNIPENYINPLDEKPIQVEECLIDPKQFPFPCKDKFPNLSITGTANASGTTGKSFSA